MGQSGRETLNLTGLIRINHGEHGEHGDVKKGFLSFISSPCSPCSPWLIGKLIFYALNCQIEGIHSQAVWKSYSAQPLFIAHTPRKKSKLFL